MRILRLGTSLSTIRAKDSIGQCHKYKGKLIKPNQTATLLDSIVRLTQALEPAVMISTAPKTGNKAHLPGKLNSLLILP